MKIELRVLDDEEMAAEDRLAERHLLDYAWHLWQTASCTERGGHWWWLELDPDDGISFWCRHCPADIDDVYPDGLEFMAGEFEVFPGYVLSLYSGNVWVNGEDRDGFRYGWHGPVLADLRIETYPGGPWGPAEYDVWVDLEAA